MPEPIAPKLFATFLPSSWIAVDACRIPSKGVFKKTRSFKLIFTCDDCGRWWESVKAKTLFFMWRQGSTRFISAEVYGQRCQRGCPSWTYPDISKVSNAEWRNVLKEITSDFENGKEQRTYTIMEGGRGDHDEERCEACYAGVCSARNLSANLESTMTNNLSPSSNIPTPSPSPAVSPRNCHTLTWGVNAYRDGVYVCKQCLTQGNSQELRWVCLPCNYDLCTRCFPRPTSPHHRERPHHDPSVLRNDISGNQARQPTVPPQKSSCGTVLIAASIAVTVLTYIWWRY